MAELPQVRVQEAVDSMVKSLERENIRKMQGLMFRCSASCCDDSQASMQQVHQCIERCHAPLAQAQALVTNELEKFQVPSLTYVPKKSPETQSKSGESSCPAGPASRRLLGGPRGGQGTGGGGEARAASRGPHAHGPGPGAVPTDEGSAGRWLGTSSGPRAVLASLQKIRIVLKGSPGPLHHALQRQSQRFHRCRE
ncbi:protein FAM136A isoform X2 [Lemur catta]|uniref:protein FAM136A isoform X2 n=1 Tax=Lemur catta TaxID=9447 RepID=UPI001E26899C|nr:protein FAM136A isoform X2 [Lemur catta]